MMSTPKCVKKCESSYNVPYSDDLHFGAEVYSLGIGKGMVEQTQIEIMKNGPVEATLDIYEDFLSYKSGKFRTLSFFGWKRNATRQIHVYVYVAVFCLCGTYLCVPTGSNVFSSP
jgi:hypothetical protein